jgi:hypothetical protein
MFINRYTFLPYWNGYFQEGNFYNHNGKMLIQKYYNGRLCILDNKKQFGILKLRKFAKQSQVKLETLPF